MGIWGYQAFDNDGACDWVWELQKTRDLSLVQRTIHQALGGHNDSLNSDFVYEAIAACEVVARLQGHWGYHDGYTEEVDVWIRSHPQTPSGGLVAEALRLLDRVLDPNREPFQSWKSAGGSDEWSAAVRDLRSRCAGA